MPVVIQLSWPANPAAEFITNYNVLQSKDGGAFVSAGNSETPNLDILNPVPGQYRFKVRATNFVGTGPESAVAEGPGLPTAPGDITVVVVVT